MIFAVIFTAYNHSRETPQIQEHDDENITMTQFSKKPKNKAAYLCMKIATLLFFALSLFCMFVYAYYNNRALSFGAYDDFTKTETISSIREKTAKGFIDQSDELPEDLSGCVLIYFKYGCPDCADIHDDLMTAMQSVSTEKIYFVSTRSEKGKTLLEKYPMSEIPSAVYILNEPKENIDYYGCLLFSKPTHEDGSTFLASNFKEITDCQSKGD